MFNENTRRVIKDVATLPAVGQSNFIYHSTTDGSFNYWNDVTGEYIKLEPLNVLTTLQPTPTATGNTANLNTVFKDVAGDTWIVDSKGDAIKATDGDTKSDYTESDTTKASYILNKPTVTTGISPPIGTATTGSIYLETDSLGNPIGSYAFNGTLWVSLAFSQVQADWTEADSSDPAFIKNKPSLSNVAISGDYSSLLNKPTIPDAQVQSDYAQADNAQVDFIKNKPDLSIYELIANKGVPNGYVPLNGSGTIDSAYLNITGTEYKGTWNPTTNTPTLSDTTGTNGWFYYVSEDGTEDLGSGPIDFQEGNIVIFDDVSNEWKRVGGQQLITNDLDASLTDFSNPILYFYGGLTDAGDWQVNKWDIPTNTKTIANLTNNAGTTNLATAWTNRLTLNYL